MNHILTIFKHVFDNIHKFFLLGKWYIGLYDFQGIQKILDNERYVVKNPNINLGFLSSGQSKFLSSSFEDILKGKEFLTAYIVTGKETKAYKDEGGKETRNKLGIRKVHHFLP